MKIFLVVVSAFLSLSAVASMAGRNETTMIVVHHSATLNGSVRIFRDYHVGVNKWEDVGYHYVIGNGLGAPDGEVQVGRDESKVGAHAGNPAPSRNKQSIGICLVGKDKFTPAQIESLKAKLAELCRKYHIKPSPQTIQRHHPDCPGKSLDLEVIIGEVARELK